MYREKHLVSTDSFDGFVDVECQWDEESDTWVSVIRSPHESTKMIDGSVWRPILVRGDGDTSDEAMTDVVVRYLKGERS